jgi:hypothetical protein
MRKEERHKQQSSIKFKKELLTKLCNTLNILVRLKEFDIKNKPKVEEKYRVVMRPKYITKVMPSGKTYSERVTDRDGNPIMERIVESKKLNFDERIDQNGNKVWYVSRS